MYLVFADCIAYLAKALAKCLHSPLMGHALQFGLLFVQKTCICQTVKHIKKFFSQG